MTHTETRGTKSAEDPHVESRGSEWTPLLSNLIFGA